MKVMYIEIKLKAKGESLHFGGKEAVPDSTSIDHKTCTSSQGQDFTSLYKIYIPLPEQTRKVIRIRFEDKLID